MPTTNDDAPAPRARRRLGRGPGADPGTGTSQPETPVAPEATEEPAAPEALVEPEPVEAPESREASGTPLVAETSEIAQVPETAENPQAPQAPQVPSAAAGAGETSGEAGDGRFTLRLENFEGPFDLLLQLISKHKLDVTEVALSKVTDDFMAHIRAMGPDWDLDQTTEFLVVAATLLDLKAARLLPVAEVEDEADLALLEARDLLFARLLQYRAYKRIADIFSDRLADEARRHPRTVGLEPQYAELLPEVVISIGAEGFARLAVKAMQPKPRPQVYVDHIHAPLVSVREQAGVVMARLREVGETTFQELVADAADTLTVVARFLALLELYRERVVDLDQAEALGALTVRWTGAEGAAPRVTDEFDRDPQERAAAAEQSSGTTRSAEAAQDGRAEEERT
ncbi:segregation/condensation protein A [Streptomyces lydicus]|uniref:segregation and condensation protein A n=1 Tax=Streptomyces lydicus TaxID=47763 RepID=UPI0037896909